MKEGRQLVNRKRRNGFLWVGLGLLAISGLAFSAWQTRPFGTVAAQATPAYQTTTVRRGNISLSASGSGSLIAAQTVGLGFTTTGNIAILNVQLGDHVKAGQVLAVQDGIEQRKVNVQTQQVAVEAAQQALDDLQANANVAVAQALVTQASAQMAVATAQAGVHYKGDPRCAPNKTEDYYFQYLYAQKNVDFWQGKLGNPQTGYGRQYILQNLNPAKKTRDLAYYNYVYCQGYTDQEIQASQANLQMAQANATQAASNYQTEKTNNGIDPNALQLDQAQLNNAEAQLAKAQADLEGATIVAPLDGVVTAVSAAAGQVAGPVVPTPVPDASASTGQNTSPSTGKGAIITLSDVSHPKVTVNIDETDLQNFGAGCSAQVTFDTLPGKTFTGVVDMVAPTLVTVNNVSVVQGQVTLDTLPSGGQMPPLGTDATVNVTCKSAQNALLVPVQALYQPAGQPAYVYILNQQGQPEKRNVVVGIKTTTSAEITGGLNQGDRVIATNITTQNVGAKPGALTTPTRNP